ncbi:uncharacterized protein [Triticum aestivum]|uniref:uncharacterized protein n=1 Tax=Triticum aestivum TaxID=4565 RepID=UPI001D034766|nr:uncharacterized protein LOC123098107 [Triticum aestivum]
MVTYFSSSSSPVLHQKRRRPNRRRGRGHRRILASKWFTVWMVDSFFDGQTIHVKQRHEKSSGELIMCRCISPSSTCCRLRLFFLCWMFGPLMLHGSIQSEKKSSYTFLCGSIMPSLPSKVFNIKGEI